MAKITKLRTMVYLKELKDSSYKAMISGVCLNILSAVDIVWLVYFVNPTPTWITTGMIIQEL